jgi:DNA-binding transcriptional MerR regulator
MAEYKIRDIESLTGIKAHTLRIWEKRYNLLIPDRTDTKIRSYNDEELLKLLNIAMLNRQGIKISHIAEMSEQEITEKVAGLALVQTTDTAIEQLIRALIQMDEGLFRSTIRVLIREHGVSAAYEQYVISFLERIGVMWLVGSINPAQEHFISNLIRQQLIAEIESLPTPEAGQPKAILFLPEHEWHELGLLLYHYHLREKGIYTLYLGQSLPYSSLLETVQLVQPDWLVTSWLTSVEETHIRHYFEQLAADVNGITVIAGGFQVKQHYAQIRHVVTAFHSLEELDLVIGQAAH